MLRMLVCLRVRLLFGQDACHLRMMTLARIQRLRWVFRATCSLRMRYLLLVISQPLLS